MTVRWVENSKVPDRLIDIWRSITNIIKFHQKLLKSKQPKYKSYKIVCDAAEVQLPYAKLYFFSFVVKIFEPYVVPNQTDKPMMPFIYRDLSALVRKIMQIIVKPKVLPDCNAAINLKKVI